jgi:GTP-binding protein LepA
MKKIRNFAIIAHVDHGKSTLADRLLEITGTVSMRQMQNQLLDSNPIERERGITIKLAPVRMEYAINKESYILNLIDTPGHVDFSYEVSRSLAACEGAILLVDATQGVQAQTLAHYQQAAKLNLKIIPALNKIDVSTADVAGCLKQMVEIFGFDESDILKISAKTGEGIQELLTAIVERIPGPSSPLSDSPFRGLVFNSSYDPHLGILAWIRVYEGTLGSQQKIYFLATGETTSSIEVGFFVPGRLPAPEIGPGEVGYVVTGLRDASHITVGDTVCLAEEFFEKKDIQPLSGYKKINPVVFVSFFPVDGSEVNTLRDALDKLRLQDSSIQYSPEFSPALGNGFRVGLLGLLHADIVQERIEREFNVDLIAAAPSVEYVILTKAGATLHISKAMDLPDPSQIQEIREPIISLHIFVPANFVGPVIQLCQDHRGTMRDMKYLGNLVHLSYTLPLSELIRNFYDQLKSVSQGYATLDYEVTEFAASELVKMDIFIAGEKIDSLSQIVPKEQSDYTAKQLVERLKNIIPRQQFEIAIQASIGAHVLARSDVKAFRKDVTAKLYGGDQTRKDKLLKKQKKGKLRMKQIGRVNLPQEAFLSILRID